VQDLEQVEVPKGQCIEELTQFGVSCIVMVAEAGQRICSWGAFMGLGWRWFQGAKKAAN